MTLKNKTTSVAQTEQIIRDALDAATECARDMKRKLGDDGEEFYTIAGELAIVWEAVSELADMVENKSVKGVVIFDA